MENKLVESSVQRHLLSLAQMDKEELVAKWKELFDTTPPEYGAVYMRRRLAHRIQELFYGGLSDDLKSQMLARKRTPSRNSKTLKPGNRIIREWHDVKYEVIIRPNGVEFEGQLYRSLSGVAKKITGTQWNGKKFFGVE
jgi:hypothetical protein